MLRPTQDVPEDRPKNTKTDVHIYYQMMTIPSLSGQILDILCRQALEETNTENKTVQFDHSLRIREGFQITSSKGKERCYFIPNQHVQAGTNSESLEGRKKEKADIEGHFSGINGCFPREIGLSHQKTSAIAKNKNL